MVWGSFGLLYLFIFLTIAMVVWAIVGIAFSDEAWGCIVAVLAVVGAFVCFGFMVAQTSRRTSMFTRQQVVQYLDKTWNGKYTIDETYWDNEKVIFYSNGKQYTATLNQRDNSNVVTVIDTTPVSSGTVK